MKNLFICILLAGLWSCTGDGNTPGQQAGNQTDDTGAVAGSVADAPRQSASGSFLAPLPPIDHPMAPILLKDYWVFEFYVVDDPAARAANKGRWFRFFEDGTFESGRWQEKTGYGSWSIKVEDGDVMLYVDNIVDADDGEWEIQGVNKDKDTMTWVGVNKTSTAGVITKVINLLTMPTKAQFGVE
ncbi:MAG: hypothetical protein KDD06_21865 [Phaeodactylibacter sp.]|nr:hypothetical protein [Phaeodactylibacter sp.]MCB9265688.1 hypothetical protein [Lewinellaceae bacterium]MCB9288392.1 hypothetical protein [Lewinellaceae bacterium]